MKNAIQPNGVRPMNIFLWMEIGKNTYNNCQDEQSKQLIASLKRQGYFHQLDIRSIRRY